MKYRFAAFALASLMCLPALAGVDEGLIAYRRKDYAQALHEWRPLADRGNAQAQYYLGILYNKGQGVDRDESKAVHWYTKAAERGHAGAQNSLGVAYENGYGVDQDFAKAVHWYTRAAEQGDAYAQFNLSKMYSNGKGVAQDQIKAAQWCTKAAEQGHMSAQFYLGNRYSMGLGLAKDEAKAAQWYAKAADQGDGDAKMALGTIVDKYYKGFQEIRTAGDAKTFITTYGLYDPAGLIPKARELERTLAQKEEDDISRNRLENEKRRKAELLEQAVAAQEQAAAAQAREQEHKRLVAWRNRIHVESKTNCGPVIEVKGNLIKVYAPVANYSSEHWLERDTLFPPEYGCSWYNGNYRAPDTN